MSRRVDQVQVIHLAAFRLVLQRRCLRLDGNTALTFDIHRIRALALPFHGLKGRRRDG